MKKKPFFYHVDDFVNCIINFSHNKYMLKANRVRWGQKLKINGRIWIKYNKYGHISIGNNVIINSGYKNNPIGTANITTFWTQNKGRIIIGNNVGLSNIAIVASEEVRIEDSVMIGGGTKIYDTDFHSLDLDERLKYENDDGINSKPIVIRKGSFIGADTIILKGVEIGENSIIGAGSVVTKSIPKGEIWGGNPAKFIRRL